MIERKNFYLKEDHAEACGAMHQVEIGFWDSPWWLPAEYPPEGFDAIGRRNRFAGRVGQWLYVKCNCTKCPAWGILRHDAALALIQEST